jgi:hypothetical protein
MLSGVRKMFGSNGPINCGRWSLIWWLRSCFLSIKWGRTLALAARTLSPSPVARSLSPVAGTLTSTQWIPTRILHRRPVSSPPSSALLPHLPHRHAFPARISGGSGSSRQRRDLPAATGPPGADTSQRRRSLPARTPRRSGEEPSRCGSLVAAARKPPSADPSWRRRLLAVELPPLVWSGTSTTAASSFASSTYPEAQRNRKLTPTTNSSASSVRMAAAAAPPPPPAGNFMLFLHSSGGLGDETRAEVAPYFAAPELASSIRLSFPNAPTVPIACYGELPAPAPTPGALMERMNQFDHGCLTSYHHFFFGGPSSSPPRRAACSSIVYLVMMGEGCNLLCCFALWMLCKARKCSRKSRALISSSNSVAQWWCCCRWHGRHLGGSYNRGNWPMLLTLKLYLYAVINCGFTSVYLSIDSIHNEFWWAFAWWYLPWSTELCMLQK